MADATSRSSPTASIEQRVAAVEAVFESHGMHPGPFIASMTHAAEEEWVPLNGGRLVAKAWTDPGFKQRLLQNGKAAAAELGLSMPAHHRHLVVLENTASVHHLICCTLCSCTAFTIIGLPPDWYKELDYRARVVRESRTVLREMGLELAPETELRVWDTTTDTRYMVLPLRPPHTDDWSEQELAKMVTKEAMIGVARVAPPAAS